MSGEELEPAGDRAAEGKGRALGPVAATVVEKRPVLPAAEAPVAQVIPAEVGGDGAAEAEVVAGHDHRHTRLRAPGQDPR